MIWLFLSLTWNQHTRIIVEHRTGSEFANACLVSRTSEKSKASEKYAMGGKEATGNLEGQRVPGEKNRGTLYIYICDGEENSRKQGRKSHMRNRTQTKVTK